MYQEKHKRSARWRHFWALSFTIAFHAAILGFLFADGHLDDIQKHIPKQVQELLGFEPTEVAEVNDELPRP